MAAAKKYPYRFTRYCEGRDKENGGERICIEAGTKVQMTKAEAKVYEGAVELVKDDDSSKDDDGDNQ